LSDEKKDLRSTGTTTVTEEARPQSEGMDMLTAEEEKVVRMRRGLAEDDEHEPKFGLGANEEALAKLANLEKFLVAKFTATEKLEGVFDGDHVDSEAKRMIIHKLQEQDE
jgi:hypothetical protein